MKKKFLFCLSFCVSTSLSVVAQTGSATEPVRYIGGEVCNPRVHDGGFRYALGVENIQVMRANRTHPESADGFGWTYNHAPNITYWNGSFYLEYLSNPKDEQQPPGHTLLVTSKDGRSWSKPLEAFPVYKAPAGVAIPQGYTGYIMHQRMGFYTAPNGRLLLLAFYGHSYNPFKEGGIGRVVREIRRDGTLGPIYFIRYSSHTSWNTSSTSYPFFTSSKDKGFVTACKSLLADKLRTLQWNDEDRGLDGFYTLKDSTNRVEAFCYYHRKDGKVVGLWKKSFAALSPDNGLSWSAPMKMPTLIMAGGKNWGQRTADGRYAMCYNPIETQPYRYPLIVTTSDDGILFDDMAVVHGEVPPRRFFGENKDFGPCYVRGIVEGEATPPDSAMWIAYSVNKEDIWVSRIPVPIKVSYYEDVNDNFNAMLAGRSVPMWNIYSPLWAPVSVASFPSETNKSLMFRDSDPYDYAKAIRLFDEHTRIHVSFKFYEQQHGTTDFQADVCDCYGNRALCLIFSEGKVYMEEGKGRTFLCDYVPQQWNTVDLTLQSEGLGTYTCSVNGQKVCSNRQLNVAVKSFDRIVYRTGDYRALPDRNTPNQNVCPPLPNCDERTAEAVYYIDDVLVEKDVP